MPVRCSPILAQSPKVGLQLGRVAQWWLVTSPNPFGTSLAEVGESGRHGSEWAFESLA